MKESRYTPEQVTFSSAIVTHSVRYMTLLLDSLFVANRRPHNSRMKVPLFLTTWPTMVVPHLRNAESAS